MKEQSFINSNLKIKDYLELDISKIREFILILEEHLHKCEKEGKFVEAELTFNKLKQFKRLENEKLIIEAKHSSKLSKQYNEKNLNDELEQFNKEKDNDLKELEEKIEIHRNEILKKHDREEIELKEYFQNKYPKQPKPPSELLNLRKILEESVKHKYYRRAHDIQNRILQLDRLDQQKHQKVREEKFHKEIFKLIEKHRFELKTFEDKIAVNYKEFMKSRATETEIIILKYKNKLSDLKKNEHFNIIEITHPGKLYSRNSSKSNINHSHNKTL